MADRAGLSDPGAAGGVVVVGEAVGKWAEPCCPLSHRLRGNFKVRTSERSHQFTEKDLHYRGGYDRVYYRYTWHGDVSALVDVNGNGDGWNNVSPFGDNGNGAYPANPNLKQYYGYGGAWG